MIILTSLHTSSSLLTSPQNSLQLTQWYFDQSTDSLITFDQSAEIFTAYTVIFWPVCRHPHHFWPVRRNLYRLHSGILTNLQTSSSLLTSPQNSLQLTQWYFDQSADTLITFDQSAEIFTAYTVIFWPICRQPHHFWPVRRNLYSLHSDILTNLQKASSLLTSPQKPS